MKIGDATLDPHYQAMHDLITEAGYKVPEIYHTGDGLCLHVILKPDQIWADGRVNVAVCRRRNDGCFWSNAKIPEVFEGIPLGDGPWLYKLDHAGHVDRTR